MRERRPSDAKEEFISFKLQCLLAAQNRVQIHFSPLGPLLQHALKIESELQESQSTFFSSFPFNEKISNLHAVF